MEGLHGEISIPQICIKPMNAENEVVSFYKDSNLTLLGSFKTNMAHCISLIKYYGLHSPKTYTSIAELQSRSEEIEGHVERVKKDSQFLPILPRNRQ